jgi:hypothetical protein
MSSVRTAASRLGALLTALLGFAMLAFAGGAAFKGW